MSDLIAPVNGSLLKILWWLKDHCDDRYEVVHPRAGATQTCIRFYGATDHMLYKLAWIDAATPPRRRGK